MPKTRTDSYLMMDYYLMNVLFDNIIVDCFLQTTMYTYYKDLQMVA